MGLILRHSIKEQDELAVPNLKEFRLGRKGEGGWWKGKRTRNDYRLTLEAIS